MFEYLTPEDIKTAESNGISYKRAYWRVYQQGWSVERAITEPINRPEVLQSDWWETAKANGISRHVFVTRIKKYDWSHEKAATTPVQDKREALIRGNRNRSSFTDEHRRIMAENGISPALASQRHHTYGWTIEDAISIPKGSVERYHREKGKLK